MIGNMADAITALFLNPGLPDIGRRTWWLVNTFHLGPKDAPARSPPLWNRIDPGNYRTQHRRIHPRRARRERPRVRRRTQRQALEASLADRLVQQHGARRYQGISVWGNLWLAFTRFGGEDAFRGLVRDGIPHDWRTGPVLADAAYPDVLVARAVSDGNDLALILRPGNGYTRTTIAVERLRPHRTYHTRGACDPVVTADPAGRALIEIDLDNRLELHLYPTTLT